MSAQHIVTAAFVKVSIGSASGNRVAALLRRGDVVPDGVAEEQLALLAKRGFVAKEKTAEKELDEGAYKGISVKDLKAEIEKRNESRDDAEKVSPAEPGNRPEVVAALLADDAKQASK